MNSIAPTTEDNRLTIFEQVSLTDAIKEKTCAQCVFADEERVTVTYGNLPCNGSLVLTIDKRHHTGSPFLHITDGNLLSKTFDVTDFNGITKEAEDFCKAIGLTRKENWEDINN